MFGVFHPTQGSQYLFALRLSKPSSRFSNALRKRCRSRYVRFDTEHSAWLLRDEDTALAAKALCKSMHIAVLYDDEVIVINGLMGTTREEIE